MNFEEILNKTNEFGVIEEANYPLVTASGLPKVKPNEIVVFENGGAGQVFSINRESVEILVLSKEAVNVGTRVTRTDSILSIPVGKELLGCVIDPLGNVILPEKSEINPQERREVDKKPSGIDTRSRVKLPFLTGVSVVDAMIPLGRGQKQLVLGDRKTGKTSFLLTTIKNQVLNGTIVIYAMIGKKQSDIKKMTDFFQKEGIMKSIILVATTSHDPASAVFISPYTAMTLAEYFRDLGQETFVILDDLSTHAKFYREISLVGRRFPGRDSYPGDIFYTHARLIERAGNFIHPEKGDVSITCFPVAETVEGDITGYITTNLIGMTDGHIYFDANIFYRGRRPAVNIPLSVTRVGRQTQNQTGREINRELTAFLALFERMQNLSHFGAELTESVKYILKTGERIYNFFEQPYEMNIPQPVQIVMLCLIWLKLFQDETNEAIREYRLKLTGKYLSNSETKALLDNLITATSFNQLLGEVAKRKEELFALCEISKQ